MNSIKGSISLIIASLIWGLAYIPTRYLGTYNFGVFFEMLIRYSISVLILGCFYYKKIILLSFRDVKYYLIIGCILFFSIILSIYGIRIIYYGSIGLLLLSLNIVFVPILNFIFYKQKIPKIILLCIIISLLGSILLTFGAPNTPPNIGVLFCFIASIGYSLYIIMCSRILNTNISPNILQFYQGVVFVVLSLPLFFIFDFPIIKTIPSETWFSPYIILSMIFISIFAGTIGYQLFFYGQKHSSPEITALILSCQSVFASLSDFFIFKIQISNLQKLSYCLIFLSIMIIIIYPHKQIQVQK